MVCEELQLRHRTHGMTTLELAVDFVVAHLPAVGLEESGPVSRGGRGGFGVEIEAGQVVPAHVQELLRVALG